MSEEEKMLREKYLKMSEHIGYVVGKYCTDEEVRFFLKVLKDWQRRIEKENQLNNGRLIENYISKAKIKTKIKELESRMPLDDDYAFNFEIYDLYSKIDILQELLG